jgi:hypothetical protein
MGTSLFNTTPAATYPALIKVGDNTSIDGTLKTLSDGAGNDLPIQVSSTATNFTQNVGIGTTSTTARLRVITADTNGIAEFFQNGVASSPLHLTRYTGLVGINLNSAAGGSTSPTPVGDNTSLSRITTNTYNGTAFGVSARIEVLTKGVQSATNYGSVMRFLTTPENTTSMNEVMSLLSDGNVQIGIGYLVAGGARLGVKGSGSTSATTSLLVQNSVGNNALQVLDDSRVVLGNSSDFAVYSGSAITVRYAMSIGTTSLPTATLQVKGSGTTSATTSLLVQNSSGTANFSITDAGLVTVPLQFNVTSQAAGGHVMAKFNDNGTLLRNNVFEIDNATGNAGQGANLAVGQTHTTVARLYVKGGGTTSGTRSFLVQNNSGTTALEVQDDTNVFVGGTNGGGLTIGNAVGGFSYYVNINSSLPGTGERGGIKWAGTTSGIINKRTNPSGADSKISFINQGIELITIQESTAAGVATNNVGINNTNPDVTAILDVASTTKGFLPPRMTTLQRNAIASPPNGLIVFDTDVQNLCYRRDSTWVQVSFTAV